MKSIFKNPFARSVFQVSAKTGFLSESLPLLSLPARYEPVKRLVKAATSIQADGSDGLLALGTFGQTLEKQLPLVEPTPEELADPETATCLFGDYSFLASAYLLEPCSIHFSKHQQYGPGRDRVPKSISIPLIKAAQAIGYPYLLFDYSHGLALYNWKLKQSLSEYKDGSLQNRPSPPTGISVDNLQPYRMFHGGEREQLFIALHAQINAKTLHLVQAIEGIFIGLEKDLRYRVLTGLEQLLQFFKLISYTHQLVEKDSKKEGYLQFRSFNFGAKGNPIIFPKGVLYEGEDEPRFERGGIISQDSIMPAVHALFQLKYANNALSESAFDIHKYRPPNHSAYVKWVRETSKGLDFKAFFRSNQDPEMSFLVYKCLNQIKRFQENYWRLTKGYIINQVKYPFATDGTPITTWLPNMMMTVLESIKKLEDALDYDKLRSDQRDQYFEMKGATQVELEHIQNEVLELQQHFDSQQIEELMKRMN